MKQTIKIGILSALTAMLLVGCGDGDSDETQSSSSTGYKAQFKSKSIGDQVEELIGGVIGIADEVGNGKMGDPLGEDISSADTTLVESQFSWNSTMDFYNNILSIKHIWDGGLHDIASSSQAELAQTITTQLNSALSRIVAISDSNGDEALTTSDLIANDGEMAFRNQILNASGRAKIEEAITALGELQTSLETLKSSIEPTSANTTDALAVVDNVIVAGYEKLGEEASKLSDALTLLVTAPTTQNIELARDQWRATREFWEAGEGHIFGPVDTLGVDPKVDSWPVDKTQLDGALDGWDPELSNIDGFPTTMKGFHAIEYLLFGDGSSLETPENALLRLDERKRQYLEALGVSFAKDIKALTDAWK
jgi:predicted lipoprotein